MNPNDSNLVQEIKSLLNSQIPKEHIYSALISRGISVDAINTAYSAATSSQMPNTTMPPVNVAASPLPVSHDEQPNRAIKTIVTIGAVMIALGIFIFIGANWQYMSSVLKVTILLAAMIISYGLGWFFEYKTEQKMLGKALIFLGALIYGASIFLVAQIFNIRANWPDGFILWMLGVFLVSYSEQSDGLRVLAIILGVLGAGGYGFISGNFFEGSFTLYSSDLLLLLAAVVLLIAGIIIRRKADLKEILRY